jgi:hypothetical protein
MNQPDSTAKNKLKIVEVKLSLKLQTSGKIAIAEQHFFKKLWNCDCVSSPC